MNHLSVRRLIGVVVAGTDLAVLRGCWVAPAALTAHLAHPRRWVETVGSDGATLELARLGLWLCAAWLGLAVLVVIGSELPGTVGRLAAVVAGRAVPTAMRRAIVTAIGASVLLAPVAAGASTTATAVGAPGVSATAETTAATATAAAGAATAGVPASTTPGSATGALTETPTVARADVRASSPPAAPVPWPHTPTPAAPAGHDVVVRPGDCLWAIAAHRIGPHPSPARVAAESRRWYHANAAVIGGDPGLIHPGQHLHQPTEKGH